MTADMRLRTGVDLVDIHRLEDRNPRIRERFLQRVYTPVELTECAGSYASLAGRFAAKEAVSKLLGTGIGRVAWQDIEVRRGPQGEPVLHLHGEAQRIARQQGLRGWSLSISHTAAQAVAFVVAYQDEGETR